MESISQSNTESNIDNAGGVTKAKSDLSKIFSDNIGGNDREGINFFDSFQQDEEKDESSSDVHSKLKSFVASKNDLIDESVDNEFASAWLATEVTRQVLTSPSQISPDMYTIPPVIVNDPQGDPVKEMLLKYVGDQAVIGKNKLTADDVSQDMKGLERLIESECWRSAIDLTGKLLLGQGQGIDKGNSIHTPGSLQLWFMRFYLLISLNLYSHAETEISCFGNLDKPDLYYDFYPKSYGGKKGCMVPFSLRLLYAELPQYLGKIQESLDRLYYIYNIVCKILTNLNSCLSPDGILPTPDEKSRERAVKLWSIRKKNILYSIGNTLLATKDYTSTIEVFKQLLDIEDKDKSSTLLSGIGRVHLQMGDLHSAEEYFRQSESLFDKTGTTFKVQRALNSGFLDLTKNKFVDASKHFQTAVDMDPDNALAINNLVVCLLYTGRLKQALVLLETLVHKNPAQYLQQGILFNLCTLYELESSFALQKKQKLLQLVNEHKGNGFNISCLKLA